MSRKYLNDRWCVRCGRKTPTPYLKRNKKHLPKAGSVLDIGCGNGRNSVFMNQLGYKVDSIDMAGDFGVKKILGVDDLPGGPYDVILANYILMFLNQKERYKVMRDILKCSKDGTMLFIEMYPAKDGYKYDLEKIVRYFTNRKWQVFRRSRERAILIRG